MKVYVSKYALTIGILERDAEYSHPNPDMIRAASNEFYHVEGREWHRTREEAVKRAEEAVKRAEEMRLAKIASLRKKIAELEKKKW
jgi:hypothetical protein